MDDYWLAVVWTLLPTVVVSAMFYFVMRSVIRADRNERREYARLEARERARRGLPPIAADGRSAVPSASDAATGPSGS